MNKYLLILFALCSIEIMAKVSVLPQWAKITRPSHAYELRPNERTEPVLVGDILFLANLDGRVYAIHRTKGSVLWQAQLPAGVDGALSYGRSKVFVGDRQGNLLALNVRDGGEAWRHSIKAEWLSAPVVIRNLVLASASNQTLYVLDERTGQEKWQYSRNSDEKMTIRGTARPVVFGANVYQGFADGSLASLNLENGNVVWVKKLRTRERFYDIDMTPYLDQESVIVGSYDGNLYHLDRLTGEQKWSFPAGTYHSVLVEEDRVYFAGLDRHFYALDKHSGKVLWKTPFEEGVGSAPVRLENYLIFTTSSDPVYILDARTGAVVWTGNLGVGSFANPVAHMEGWFYCFSNYGNLYAFTLRDLPLSLDFGTIAVPSALHSHLVDQRKHREPAS